MSSSSEVDGTGIAAARAAADAIAGALLHFVAAVCESAAAAFHGHWQWGSCVSAGVLLD